MGIEYIRSEEIYHGRAFDVRRDLVRLPDRREVYYDIVYHTGAVTLVPVDDQGKIWFVRQYRSGARDILLELPAGTLETNENPEVCADREVREEIGLAATRLEKIGEAYLAPGYSTEYMHYYLATGLYDSPLKGDEDEFLETEAIPIREVFRMVEQGNLRDTKTLAALLLALPPLKERYADAFR